MTTQAGQSRQEAVAPGWLALLVRQVATGSGTVFH